jgi:hypothetical protein
MAQQQRVGAADDGVHELPGCAREIVSQACSQAVVKQWSSLEGVGECRSLASRHLHQLM